MRGKRLQSEGRRPHHQSRRCQHSPDHCQARHACERPLRPTVRAWSAGMHITTISRPTGQTRDDQHCEAIASQRRRGERRRLHHQSRRCQHSPDRCQARHACERPLRPTVRAWLAGMQSITSISRPTGQTRDDQHCEAIASQRRRGERRRLHHQSR